MFLTVKLLYFYILGGRSMEGSPIITFPDHNSFHLLNDRDYQRLIQYLVGVTSLQGKFYSNFPSHT